MTDKQAFENAHPDIAMLTALFDDALRLPGTNFRFGLDGLLGFVPIAGDAVTALVSVYLMAKAHRYGASRRVLFKMGRNVGIDFLAGAVPVFGDLFDFAFKANRMNLELLRAHLEGGQAQKGERHV